MENILKEIDLEIKKIVQSDEINTQKLIELINIRDRLKGYNITSVSQFQGFDQLAISTTPPTQVQSFRPINSAYDSLSDMANLFLKNQTKQSDTKNINDLIYYHKFILELEMSTETEINNERLEIKNEIEELIIKGFRNIINERKNKEKDKISNVEEKSVEETYSEVQL